MKYNLDDIYWQQFELLSFKCLKEMIAPGVTFIEGGSDKGRDIIFTGKFQQYFKGWDGKWIFQCKHKTVRGSGEIVAGDRLKAGLNEELVKVFVTNNLKFDNYVLVTNLTVSGTLYDDLNAIFDEFQVKYPGLCKNFGIISYRDLEDCLENNPKIVWRFLSILNHADFELLFNTPFQRLISTRSKGWFQGIAERKNSFVYTRQTENAISSLNENHIIILTGPPKSGKTFTAEMIALYYFGEKEYEAIKIDDPDEVEKFYNPDKKQLFVCDDAFGSHILSYTHADDWNRKLETVFNLADANHKFIFSSRENIYQAFTNYAKDFDKDFLPKTTIASDNLTDAEKGAILDRYVQLSDLPETVKQEILINEDRITTHQNFTPESIRAFFRNKTAFTDKENAVFRLLEHLNNPDQYLKDVFYNLGEKSKAAVLSVLCAPENNFSNVQRTYAHLRDDLGINDLLPTTKEFDELNGAILKVTKDEQVEAVDFYHPSMQEFLIREVAKDKHGNLRKTILKNLNSTLIRQFLLELPNLKEAQKSSKAILISGQDLKLVKIGIERLIENEEIKLYDIISATQWILSPETSNSKMFARTLFTEMKELVEFIYNRIFEETVFNKLKEESVAKWMNFLLTLKSLKLIIGSNPPGSVKKLIVELLKAKRNDREFWRVALAGAAFLEDNEFREAVGDAWFNSFPKTVISDVERLGNELYPGYFPDSDAYWKARRARGDKTENLETKRYWYPAFLVLQTKMSLLKLAKGKAFNESILQAVTEKWDVLLKASTVAKRRHHFIVRQGWWEKTEIQESPKTA